MSALKGPQVYDIRFQGERVVYELGLAEIGVSYAGSNPMLKITDFVDSAALLGKEDNRFVN